MENKNISNEETKDIGKDISSLRVISQLVINADIREIDIYMMVKYYVCMMMKDNKNPVQIMEGLKKFNIDMVRNSLSNLIIDYGKNFQMPATINSIPESFNMFISDTTSRLVMEFIKDEFYQKINNEGKQSRTEQEN